MGRPPSPTPAALLIVGVVLVALNLRPTIAGFGPLLSQVQRELHVSATTLSLLTTIPLLCFGFLAPLAAVLTRRSSTEAVILGGIVLTALGALLRVGPSLPWILLGTLLAGAGIAVINVLLPVLVKRDFASRAGLMTGVYTLFVVGGATLASALSVPLRTALGGSWRASLGVWAAFALVGILAWLPAFLGRHTRVAAQHSAGASVWKNPAALSVTVFMGMQSLIFYTWLTWLPKLLQDHGVSVAGSGALLALGNLVQLPFTLAVPIIASKMPDQRLLVVGSSLLVCGGLLGLLLFPPVPAVVSVVLLGAGCGSTFSLALALIVQRAQHPRQVPELSALAQGAGYLLAATGPFVFGWLHDRSANAQWSGPLWFLLICTVVTLLSGWRAAKPNEAAT